MSSVAEWMKLGNLAGVLRGKNIAGGGASTTTLSVSRALTSADKGVDLVYSGSSNITLTTIAGLVRFTVVQSSTGTVTVTGATGTAATSSTNRRVVFTEVSSGVYQGDAGGGGSTSSTIAVAASRTAVATDSGLTLELAANATYTLDSSVALPAGVSVMGPTTGTATLAVSGGATINGGTTSISVSAGQLYAVVPRVSSASAYIVRGS